MAERVTRQQVEVAASGIGKLRVTRQAVEILSTGVLYLDASNTLVVSQEATGFLLVPGRVTRQQVEVAASGIGKLRVTRQAIEIISTRQYSLNPRVAYATLAEGEDYFAQRLHADGWQLALPKDRLDALIAATQLIDTLNFKGHKHTVYELLNDTGCGQDIGTAFDLGCITKESLQNANLAQELEFPRDSDTSVPEAIRDACLEIANALLEGMDAELELEKLSIFTPLAGAFGSSYERRNIPIEHLVNLIPSTVAWSWIKPFLIDEDAIKITRIN